jgi:hypothetical protein
VATQTTEPVAAERARARRSRARQEAGSRRLVTARRAIVVALLAIGIGTLLNAESVRRTAEIQPEGWRRDVGLALTEPLVDVSRALRLEVPRKELRRALGRADQGTGGAVTFTKEPQTRPQPTSKRSARHHATKPKIPPAKPAFSPSHPLRLWVAGDSLAITPGWQLVRTGDRTHVIKAVGAKVDGQVATGLERPDVFDWFGHIRKEVSRLHPNAVVLTFGANDDHDLVTGVPAGRKVGPFGSSSWVREYRRRVGGVMDDVTSRGALLVWIGLPIARDSGLSEHFRVLNRIYRSEAKKRAPKVAYIDTYSLFQDKSGHFSEYLARPNGTVVKMRTGDGVHYEDAGGQQIAWYVLRELNRVFDLHSWKK